MKYEHSRKNSLNKNRIKLKYIEANTILRDLAIFKIQIFASNSVVNKFLKYNEHVSRNVY